MIGKIQKKKMSTMIASTTISLANKLFLECVMFSQTISLGSGAEVVLDASESYDPDADLPDRNALKFRWFQYKEPSDEPHQTSGSAVPELDFDVSSDGRVARMKMPAADVACYKLLVPHRSPKDVEPVCFQLHVILEVTGSGSPPIRRYKRAILKLQQPQDPST